MPDEWRDVVERPGRRREALQRGPKPALPVDDVVTPQLVQQAVVLKRQRDALADVLTKPRVDRTHVASPEHQIRTPAGQVLQHGEVLGDLHRIVRRDQCRRGRQEQPFGARRDEAEERCG